ncbi:MAG: hypothetical protein ACI4MP_08550 [Candidatus Ventricola sp.]
MMGLLLDITIGYFFLSMLNFASLVCGRGMCYAVVTGLKLRKEA